MATLKTKYKSWSLISKISFWASIITALSFIIMIAIYIVSNYEQKKKIKEETRRGVLKNRNNKGSDTFYVKMGGISCAWQRGDLESGVVAPIVCNTDSPISIKLANGKIVLSMKFYNIDNEIVGEIVNSEWLLNTNFFKRNYDDYAIEVIDNYDVVVMQIRLEDNKITINGIIHCSNLMFICNEDSMLQLDTNYKIEEMMKQRFGRSLKETYFDYGRKIQRLFDYTGKDWLGKRAKFNQS
jgi:hypothetical protein